MFLVLAGSFVYSYRYETELADWHKAKETVQSQMKPLQAFTFDDTTVKSTLVTSKQHGEGEDLKKAVSIKQVESCATFLIHFSWATQMQNYRRYKLLSNHQQAIVTKQSVN